MRRLVFSTISTSRLLTTAWGNDTSGSIMEEKLFVTETSSCDDESIAVFVFVFVVVSAEDDDDKNLFSTRVYDNKQRRLGGKADTNEDQLLNPLLIVVLLSFSSSSCCCCCCC